MKASSCVAIFALAVGAGADALPLAGPPPSNANASSSLPVGSTWMNYAWCGGDPDCHEYGSVEGRQVVFVDLVATNDTEIASLRNAGKTVICSMSGGATDARLEMLANRVPGMPPSERSHLVSGPLWLDFVGNRSDAEIVVSSRLQLAVSKGCNGVDVGDLDCWELPCLDAFMPGDSTVAAAQLEYNAWIADEAHARGLLVGLRSDNAQVPQLADKFDFAANEACLELGQCDVYTHFTTKNKAVFNVEFFFSSAAEACMTASSMGFSTLLADQGKWYDCRTEAISQ